MATEMECNAAWSAADGNSNNEHEDHYEYFGGCNCGITNDYNWHDTSKHYPMMFVHKKKNITTEQHPIPIDICDDDGNNNNGDDESDQFIADRN